MGRLAGAVDGACDSWPWGSEFEPNDGHADDLKKLNSMFL